ncbi:uncharacterized protein [Panulirus ornatus]|uniref:uncharacterized protein n=1 Tax=Panulirus ornatus TaxID=150431 RepID=UPI003A8802E7
MASIQKKTTRTTKTTSTEATGEVQTKSSTTTSAEMTSQKCITITKKGQFFSDSCFEDTRQDYQDAIKDVLSKWGDKTSTTDDMTSYRQLRTRDMRDENMAVKSSDDELYHKIVVDVNEFIKDGDVSVKTVGERELVVQGRMEKQEGNRKSSKSFKRSFILPEDVEIETLTSVVSSDGVMIIKARRKQSTEQMTGVSKSINVQKTETKKQVQTSSTTTTAGQDVKTMVVKTQEVPEETVTQKKVTTVTREVKTMEDDTGSRPLPITKKGSFFDDSFFEDSRQDFQTAIKQVLQKSNVTSQTDDITTYRNLRQQNLKEENQAVTVSDDQQTHKIIVDVQDFVNGGVINVKTVDDREVVIEGHIEKQEGNTKSSKRFCKRFTLPEDILVESVSCVVSADGVLTIKAPRKPSTEQVTGITKSIDVQKTETKQQVQTSTTTTTEGQDVKAVVVKPQEVPEETVTQKKVTTVTREVTTTEDDTGSRPLPITKKGSFFDDSFFEDSRQDFQTAIKQVLQKSNVTSQTDDITTYRNLRQQNLKEENQAVTVSDDQQTHKIIVDVQDFVNGGVINVKTVNDREVVIEGHIEKQEGNTKSSNASVNDLLCLKIFWWSLCLVWCQLMEYSLSKLREKREINPSTEQVTGITKSIDVQKTETKQQVQTSTTTTTEGQDVKAVEVKPQEVPEETQETVTQKKVTTVTREVTTTEDDTGSRPLPITKKGSFFDDSFFEDSRQDFQTAIKQVLQKSNVTSQTDDITTYRNLRQQNLKEENQAVTVSDDQQTHKIIVDVQDFVNGGVINVKTVNDREVVIEGHIEKQEGNTKSSKRFCKRFTLPEDILVESLSCVVSADGVLTIKAPRKPSTEQVTGITKSIDVQKTETKQQVQTSTTTTTEGQDVKAVVVKPQEVPEETQETVTQKKVTTVTREVTTTEDDTGSRPLPITKKGSFFDDSFFEDSRQVFQTAVKQVLEKSNVKSSETDDITTYRKLRQQNLKDDNQAVTVSDDQKTHKIIVDVKDFVDGGEVTVKIVKEREIVIEGHIEKQEGNTKSSKRFCKRFTLSEDILVESVSCVVSDDGVLTIIAPRKPSPEQVTEVSKTIDVQKTETKQQVQTSTTTTTEGQDVKAVVVKPQEVPEETQETVTQKKVTTVTREVTTTEDDTGSRPLPITKKGSFFDDSFFEDSRQVFQTAVKQVLEKSNVKSSETDDITTYRNLRQQNLKDDNQAVTVSDDQKTHKIIVDVKDFVDGGEVTVKIVKEREIVIEGHIEKQEGNKKSSKRFCKRFTLSEDILVESVSCVVSDDGVLTIIAPRKPSPEQVTEVSKTIDVQKTETKQQVQTSTTTTEGQDVKAVVVKPQEVPEETQETVTQKKVTTVTREVTTTEDDTGSRPLPITKKGSFFDDSFFEDSRQVFQTAVKQVLEKSNVKASETDDITTYRKLRQQNLKDDNQAVTVSDDQKTHKIIVDVKDFVDGGEVTVKIVKEREIVIEGHIEKQEGNTKSSKRFCKRFTLSEDILVESVSCVVSDDGVLTIIAPRKPSPEQVSEVSKTIDVQKTETKKQVQTSTTTTTEGQDVKAVVVKPQEVPEETQETVTQKKVTTVTREVTTTEDDTGSRPLPITKKGSFFDDSFFEDSRQVFQTAVKQVLEKSNVKSSETDDITTYRKLRQQNLKDDNQAVTVSDDQKTHKIIVDVKDFVDGGEVTVKIVKEREIVIEGHIEKQEGNKKSSKRFCKRFTLSEDILVESVSCVVSDDGVLTIIAPRKPSPEQVTEVSKTIDVQKTETTKQVQTSTTTTTEGQDVKAVVVKPQEVPEETQETVTQKKVTTVTREVTTTEDDTGSRPLPITKKGSFFDDSFFEDSRQVFQTAVKQVLEKSNVKSSETDDITTYRKLRQQNLKDDNQAVTVSDDQKTHKIIVDVKDFMDGGEVTVKIVKEREIVIEGHIEKQEGNKKSSKRFCKRFTLSEDILVESVSCVVSDDGVLTIIAPRKPSPEQVTEVSKTIDVQKTETKKQVQTSTTTTTEGQDVKAVVVKPQEVPEETQETVTQKKVTTVTREVTTTEDDTGSRPLPITKKGSFFDDSFFEDSRQVFQTAIKKVLQKFNVKSKTDDITTYRKLRQQNLKEENQAVTASDDQKTHKIIVDVKDFIEGGEVTVKIVKEREIVVEGRVEKQEGKTKSTKRFCKRFILSEDILVESVTCVVSSDGVLTIIAPRKPSAKQVTEESQTIKTDTKKQVQTSTKTTKEGQDVKETVVKTQKVAKDTQEAVSQKDVEQEKKVTSVTQKVKTVKDESSKETISRVLVIIKKGLFSEDSFFVEIRQVYQRAVKQVLEKMKVTFSQTDYITSYRNLRRRNTTEETQAVTTHDDQKSHKIILDVKEFATDGVVTAKVVNEREVVIEGHIEKKQVITKRFCKRFVLSQEVQVESVSCVMSADGVLVITASRKGAALEKKETTTKTEKSVEKSTAETVDRSTITKPLPITQKGDFFTDATFEGARQDYQSAVKSVLEKLKVKASKGEEYKTYRNLRKSKPKNENQAVSVKDEKEYTQIVLDVCDFIGGVKVKIVEGSEIVVEGKGNRQEGMSVVSFSFLRRFLVPDDAVYDAITTFMSSEGILTITIPKKQ